MKKLESVQNQLKKIISSRRFKLTAEKYYVLFTEVIDKRPKRKNKSRRNEKKQKLVMMQIPVNLNDDMTAHKLQGVTKKIPHCSQLDVHTWVGVHSAVKSTDPRWIVSK